MEPLEIDEDAVDADMRGRMRGVDPDAAGAATLIWQGFLAHTRRPLAWGEVFAEDPGNDMVSFSAQRTRTGDEWSVKLERSIGVCPHGEYEGTILATCRVRVPDGPAWSGIADHWWAEEEGVSEAVVDAFQAEVEASPAFAAWLSSPLRDFIAYARYG